MNAAATTEPTALPRSPSLPTFFDNLDSFAEAPEGVAKLRELILDLAVRGKLVEQDENDEPASEFLSAIFAGKQKLADAKEIPKPKKLPEIDSDKTPFQIPDHWEWIRLESVCEVITKGSSPKWQGVSYVDNPEDGVLFITSENVGVYTMRKLDEPKFVEKKFNEMETRSILQRNDILVNLVGASIGRSALWDRDAVANINQAVGIIRFVPAIESLDRRYLLHYLNSPECLAIMFENQVETARANISLTNVKHFLVPVPPLSEQRRIVSKVDGLMSLCDELESRGSERVRLRERASRSCLDRLVSSHSRRDLKTAWQRLSDQFEVLYDTPETLAHLRQSILQLAVQGKLVPQDPNDEPAATLHARIAKERARYSREHGMKTKATETNDNGQSPWPEPPGWIWTRLATLFNVVTDGDHLPPPKTEDGIAFLTIGNVTTGELDFNDCRYVPEDYYENLKQFRKPKRGDILYTVVGATYGRPAIVETDRPFCVQRHIAILKPASEVDVSFLKSLLASPFIYEQATRNTSGTAQPTVPLGPLREFLVPLPPLAEQKRIVAKVDQLLSQCDELSAQLREGQSASQQLLTATIHHLLNDSRQNQSSRVGR